MQLSFPLIHVYYTTPGPVVNGYHTPLWYVKATGDYITESDAVETEKGLIVFSADFWLFYSFFFPFVEIPKVITDNWDSVTRGSLGLVGLPGLPNLHLGSYQFDIGASPVGSYYFVLSYALLTLCLVAVVFRSNLGLALHAIREEEVAAEAVGIQVRSYHLLALLLSALFTGIGGACYAHLIRYIEPGLVYGLHFSAVPMIFAICGGRFTVIGPPLAALVLYPLDQFIFHPLLPAGHEFLYGVVIILVILFVPSGFWGRLRKGHLVSVKTGSIE